MTNYNIYPKQFRNAGIPIEKNRCFMLMPFSSNYDYVYGEVKKYLNNADYICNRADEIFGCIPIMSNILQEILKAHFIIADLTGQNANVFYELGIAHSFKDAHNIILITQNIDNIPFDIRHLSTIIYSENNIKHLISSILKTINDNKYYYNFYEVLQKKGVINYIHDDKSEFIDTLQQKLGSNLEVLTNILNEGTEKYSESNVKSVLDACLGILYSSSMGSGRAQLKGVMKVIALLLSKCEEFHYSHEVMKHLLYEIKLENYPVGTGEIISLQSELAISLASNNVFFDQSISWIISYFSRSKSATVDLNRYSLERFLLTTDNIEVDSTIVDSMMHENCYIREHMADIIGEKRILAATPTLLTQLQCEENIYTTSSIITALGKIGDARSYVHIARWFNNNKERIVSTQHFFIFKHIYRSLCKLDSKNEFTLNFEAEYSDYLVPSAILS